MLRETRGQSFENQFRDAAALCEQLERELNQAKELMETAAIWIEACPFENAIPLSLKLRAAAMPNEKS